MGFNMHLVKSLFIYSFFIFSSTLFAQEWNWLNPTPQGNTLKDIVYFDGNIFAVGNSGTLLRSEDGGITWNVLTINTVGNINKVIFNEQIGYLCTSKGEVFKSNDKGFSWSNIVYNNPDFNIISISFNSANEGYIIGEDNNSLTGLIYKTSDGGINWIKILDNPNYLAFYDITFVENSIICVGTLGTILKSTDGGISWNVKPTNNFNSLKSVYFINSQLGFICGLSGTLLKTTDSGESWINVSTNEFNNLNKVIFNNLDDGILIGGNGTLLKTTNAGES